MTMVHSRSVHRTDEFNEMVHPRSFYRRDEFNENGASSVSS